MTVAPIDGGMYGRRGGESLLVSRRAAPVCQGSETADGGVGEAHANRPKAGISR